MGLTTKWGLQTVDFLQKTRTGHPRKREKWLALFWLAQDVSQAEIARRLGRTRKTVQAWKEKFEKHGPQSLDFKRPGGRSRILSEDEGKKLAYLVATQNPKDVGMPGIRWSLKKAVAYCRMSFGKYISTEACRVALHRNGLALKLPKKTDKGQRTQAGGFRQGTPDHRKNKEQQRHHGVH